MNKEITDGLFLKRVFFVGSKTDDTVLVAIDPCYDQETKTLTWWDTVKERKKAISLVEPQENGSLKVIDESGGEYFFVPLNLGLYNSMVREKLSGKRSFGNEDEMIKAFEETVI